MTEQLNSMVGSLYGQLAGFDALDFLFGNTVSMVINGIIILLLLTALYMWVSNLVHLRAERRGQAKVATLLDKADRDHAEKLLEELKQAKVSGSSQIMKAIEEVRRVRSLTSQSDILASIRVGRVPRASWNRYLVGTLIILGLIGTIWGLSQAVIKLQSILSGVGGSVDENTFSNIITQIISTLGFMNTAFSTTICGFVASLTVSLLDFFYQRFEASLHQEYENLVVNRIVPFFTPRGSEDSLAQVVSVLKTTGASFNDAAAEITRMVGYVSENQDRYNQLAESMQATVEGVTRSQNELSEQYLGLGRRSTEIIDLVNGLARQLERNQDATETLFDRLADDRGILENFYNRLDQSLNSLSDNIHTGLQDTGHSLRAVTQMQNHQIQRLEQDHDEQVRGAAQRLVELAEITRGINQELKAEIEQALARQHEGRLGLQEALRAGLAGIGNKLVEQQQQDSEREYKIHQQLSSDLSKVSARQIEMLEKSHLALDGISSALKARLGNPGDGPTRPTNLNRQYQDLRQARREMTMGLEPRGWRKLIHPFQWRKSRRYKKQYGLGAQALSGSPTPQPEQRETPAPAPTADAASKADSGD